MKKTLISIITPCIVIIVACSYTFEPIELPKFQKFDFESARHDSRHEIVSPSNISKLGEQFSLAATNFRSRVDCYISMPDVINEQQAKGVYLSDSRRIRSFWLPLQITSHTNGMMTSFFSVPSELKDSMLILIATGDGFSDSISPPEIPPSVLPTTMHLKYKKVYSLRLANFITELLWDDDWDGLPNGDETNSPINITVQ